MKKQNFIEEANIFKVLSDSNRLQILNMLSVEEICACKILEQFNITQPTLSHHMKVLVNSGLAIARKDGNWMYYKLNYSKINEIKKIINEIL